VRQGKSTPEGAELELGAVMFVTEHSIFSAQVAPEEGMGPPQMKMSAQIRRAGIGWPASAQVANASLLQGERNVKRAMGEDCLFFSRFQDDGSALLARGEEAMDRFKQGMGGQGNVSHSLGNNSTNF
jgi:hypothetical protein